MEFSDPQLPELLTHVWRLTKDPAQLQTALQGLTDGEPLPGTQVGVLVDGQAVAAERDQDSRILLHAKPSQPATDTGVRLEWVQLRDQALDELHARSGTTSAKLASWPRGSQEPAAIAAQHGYELDPAGWGPPSSGAKGDKRARAGRRTARTATRQVPLRREQPSTPRPACEDPQSLALQLSLARFRLPAEQWSVHVDQLPRLQHRNDDDTQVVIAGWTFTDHGHGYQATPGWTETSQLVSYDATNSALRLAQLTRRYDEHGLLSAHHLTREPAEPIPQHRVSVPRDLQQIEQLLESVEHAANLPTGEWIRDEHDLARWEAEYPLPVIEN